MGLTIKEIGNAKPGEKPYKLAIPRALLPRFTYRSEALALALSLRWQRKDDGAGKIPDVMLKEARDRDASARKVLDAGIDPTSERKAQTENRLREVEERERQAANSFENGVSVTYSYDDLNRLSTVADANLIGVPTNVTQYSYDNASNVGSVQYPNGITTQFTYDTLNRVISAASGSNAGTVSSYTYQRGPTGNLTNVVELGGR